LLRRALLEVVLVGALGGVVGTHVVLRRLPFATMALAHATFPGVVVAHLLGLPLVAGSGGMAAGVALVLARLGAAPAVDTSSAAGVVLAGSTAVGVVLAASGPSPAIDLSAFLVGSVLTVAPADVIATVAVAGLIVVVLAALRKELVLSAFDPEAARTMGYPVGRLDVVMLVIVALTLVVSVPAVGVILSVALLVAPAAAARQWVSGVGPTMALAAVFGAMSGVGGLAISHRWSVAAGAAVVLVAAAIFALSVVAGPHLQRNGRSSPLTGMALGFGSLST
jgi:manganese/iron transport system permease protein